ncbi:LamB/YcsF family/allophanate hydrolase family protein [Myxococcus stipitatus DSM 14675]|uniref:LamB/YcsF family/allophanate hydrolase family protein n=1 Tax=Myxococcus stipitatus (strain DSM 14675 / JCM 12634 / Mx s8) TaxID=1278073 RepID=L7U5C4_MYXSD|nr:LamB/YcsF family protein [Myxococcus stipitatus]AGC43025.1 LamB/YcsF family/allophanate hydrolase family protein [Myxococcus stipitatus DSM 14675]
MTECLLNIDLGELPDEDERLYAFAQVANIACGAHAGDDASMRRALELCARHGTRACAHPSYEDREGFGRRAFDVAPDVLRGQVASQCARLARLAREQRVPVVFVKPHGALYHAANASPALARALVAGVVEALGSGITLIAPPTGALRDAAIDAGLPHAREAFADRGTRPDGSLIPRGQPGAVLTDAAQVRRNAVRLATHGDIDTLCVHGDTPGAVELAREVRSTLDALALPIQPLGDGALRFSLPDTVERRAAREVLKALPGVVDAVVTEQHACVYFDPSAPPEEPRLALSRLLYAPMDTVERALVTLRIRYDGPDLEKVAARAGLSVDDVARLHAAREYTVRCVGFLPGFAYLGELDPRIVVPRLPTPRMRVPALAVGIAGARTGVYPFASPGGWSLIGTAMDFTAFHPDRGAVLQLGDRVRFEQVG